MRTILALNYGSSSLKFATFNRATLELVARGRAERRPQEPDLAECLRSAGVLTDEVAAVSHRIVHAGPQPGPTRLSAALRDLIERSRSFAPLHDAAALAGIAAADSLVGPNVPQVAVFDTSFHFDLPHEASAYALPLGLVEKFHGFARSCRVALRSAQRSRVNWVSIWRRS